MSVTPEQLAERDAAIVADDAAAGAAEAARVADEAAQQALAEASSRAVSTQQQRQDAEAQRQQTAARRVAADNVILASLRPGEIRGLHPEPVPILMRDGDRLVEGTLHPIHAEVAS